MANVKFKRGTTAELEAMPVENGSILYNTDNGQFYVDTEFERLSPKTNIGKHFKVAMADNQSFTANTRDSVRFTKGDFDGNATDMFTLRTDLTDGTIEVLGDISKIMINSNLRISAEANVQLFIIKVNDDGTETIQDLWSYTKGFAYGSVGLCGVLNVKKGMKFKLALQSKVDLQLYGYNGDGTERWYWVQMDMSVLG